LGDKITKGRRTSMQIPEREAVGLDSSQLNVDVLAEGGERELDVAAVVLSGNEFRVDDDLARLPVNLREGTVSRDSCGGGGG
jgi:hypothetical protein